MVLSGYNSAVARIYSILSAYVKSVQVQRQNRFPHTEQKWIQIPLFTTMTEELLAIDRFSEESLFSVRHRPHTDGPCSRERTQFHNYRCQIELDWCFSDFFIAVVEHHDKAA